MFPPTSTLLSKEVLYIFKVYQSLIYSINLYINYIPPLDPLLFWYKLAWLSLIKGDVTNVKLVWLSLIQGDVTNVKLAWLSLIKGDVTNVKLAWLSLIKGDVPNVKTERKLVHLKQFFLI